ncbi:EI24 domain-containing protein [Caminibacter pacificus]|jgi:hypothetical protein|uniref:Etoposide-induced protein 2.4 (EI24) n=1 Tax=Caminibacter pacificus TaxID=1424653 RepID=A0AAJ4RDA6_9BACT|nr:EI24 domain-containing protein [Caminibacter pacificus]NPA87680.1 hypothetical protein [Campylobacterota bacterium]QCI28735.1 hypothetical protein C6V80_07085 [Caminibacter pacificus]ROR40531.1 etoposide-induced protein 2.4 (EI24) [Caminibacter pacificus]
MKISSCFVKSFRDLFNVDVLKVVLISALPLFLLIFGFLYAFWDQIISVSSFLISWVPFSVLKLNGAFFILFFVWFILVLVSFAVVTAIFSPIFLNKLKERGYYLYSIITIGFFSLLYAVLLIKNWDYVFEEVKRLLTILPFDTVSKGVSAIVAVYIFYNFFILSLFFVIFIFSKPFLEAIRELEYPELEINVEDKFKYKRAILKDILIFIALFAVLFPLFFIPVINVGVQLFLWTKLYRDSFLYFVCNEYCSKDEFEKLSSQSFKTSFVAFLAALFNLLPIINFFAPFFAVIMFFHCVMELKLANKNISVKEEN